MTTQHRERVWYGMLDAERLTRYYLRLATRFERYNFALNVVIAIFSLGAAAVLLAELPQWISATLFFVVAGAVIWMSYANYSKKHAIALMVSKQCSETVLGWRQLWYDLDAPNGAERASDLERRLNEITDVELNVDDKLNQSCAEEAYEVCQAEYAS